MYILGISAYYHDSAAAILKDGKIIAAAQEERFSRKKQDDRFPHHAIEYCLKEAGCRPEELDCVAFYDKPFLKFERLLETFYAYAPKGVLSFVNSIPIWIKEKLFLKQNLKKELLKKGKFDFKRTKIYFPEHHLSHAASAYYPSPYNEAAILTLDGVGEWATTGIFKADGKNITILKQLNFPHSIGLLYSAFTYFLGFRVNSGEYKLMGLAPYGITNSEQVNEFVNKIKTELISLKEDGSIWMNPKYFSYATSMRMLPDKKWASLFGVSKRVPEEKIEQVHCNLAIAIQQVTEEIVLKMAVEAKRITGSNNLCLAGGVALNCVANGKLQASGIFDNVYIQPAAGDAGGALGAALSVHYLSHDNERLRTKEQVWDDMQGSYLGPEYSDIEIQQVARKYNAVVKKLDSFEDTSQEAAKALSEGLVLGWFQGRMEFGPRALGNRSILGDPRNEEMQLKLNLKIKYRESFRPFAPSVLFEDRSEYFDMDCDSPYMLLVAPISEKTKLTLPADYASLGMREKLYVNRSTVPAITHVDNSARVQTVHPETNPQYYQLIKDFKELTGVGMLVNTSFNVRGEPIVCTPDDAYNCFIHTEMDVLVMNNYIFYKSDQIDLPDKESHLQQFDLD